MAGVAGYLHLVSGAYMAAEQHTHFEHFALHKRRG